MALDLSGASRAVEGLMEDGCVVWGPWEPRSRDMDPDTLRIEELSDAPVHGSFEEPAPFKFRPASGAARESVEGGVSLADVEYKVDLPLSAPFLAEGSRVLVAYSRRMPNAAGAVLVIGQPLLKTVAVQASYRANVRRRTEQA